MCFMLPGNELHLFYIDINGFLLKETLKKYLVKSKVMFYKRER